MSHRTLGFGPSVLTALALVLMFVSCLCTKHKASSLAPEDPKTGTGGPPRVYGRARYDSSTVRLDLKVTQSSPYTAAEIVVSYATYDEGGTPAYISDPHGAYVHTPGEDWIVECIQPKIDKPLKYFQVMVQVNNSIGAPILTSTRIIPLDLTFSICEPWWLFP